jgi:RNA recognition motif-containing protein
MRSRNLRGNVFVANLPPDFSDERLAEIFDPFGIVLSAYVARDPASGKRLRYGFVDIATEHAAARAVSGLNGVAVDGHSLDVRISERKEKKAQPKKPERPALAEVGEREMAERETGERAFAPPAPRRRQSSFVVERRPLPRRS